MKVKQAEPEGFETLWQVWRPHARHTDGRGKARPMYARFISAGTDPQDIIDGATYHIRSMQEKDKPYINLLSVYIYSERWKDECLQERAFQARLAEREAKRTAPPPKPIIQPEQPSEDRMAAAKRVYEKLNIPLPEGLH